MRADIKTPTHLFESISDPQVVFHSTIYVYIADIIIPMCMYSIRNLSEFRRYACNNGVLH